MNGKSPVERLMELENLLDQLDTWLLILGTTFGRTKAGAQEQRAKIRKVLGRPEPPATGKVIEAHGAPAGTLRENGDSFTETSMEEAFRIPDKMTNQSRVLLAAAMFQRLSYLTEKILPEFGRPDTETIINQEIGRNKELLASAEKQAEEEVFLPLRMRDELIETHNESPRDKEAGNPYMEYLKQTSPIGPQEAIVKLALMKSDGLTELMKNQVYRIASDMDKTVEKIQGDVAKILKRVSVWKQP